MLRAVVEDDQPVVAPVHRVLSPDELAVGREREHRGVVDIHHDDVPVRVDAVHAPAVALFGPGLRCPDRPVPGDLDVIEAERVLHGDAPPRLTALHVEPAPVGEGCRAH